MERVIWLFGRPCSGKTTLAKILQANLSCGAIDGDSIRTFYPIRLGWSEEDRHKNAMRAIELTDRAYNSRGQKEVIISLITPLEKSRKVIKEQLGNNVIMIYIKAPLEVCEERDIKGMYAKARKGEIKQFTGIDSPFEEPKNPDLIVETDKYTIEENIQQIMEFLKV